MRTLDEHRFTDTGEATHGDKWAGAAEQLEHEFSHLREQRASREVLRARLDYERRRVEPRDDVDHEILRLRRRACFSSSFSLSSRIATCAARRSLAAVLPRKKRVERDDLEEAERRTLPSGKEEYVFTKLL